MMLDVKDLKMYFPVKQGLLRRTTGLREGRRRRHPLRGERRDPGPGRRVRLRQDDRGQMHRKASPAHQWQSSATKASTLRGWTTKDMKRYRKKMQIVFQDPFGSLNPRMTVSDIVGEGLAIMGENSGERRVAEILETVGLSKADGSRYPHEFSGGQRQRIGIARALAVNPSFVVCDEPVSALDVSIQAQIINLLEDLQAKFSLSYLFVAHDLSVVRHIADRIVVMYVGKVMEEAPTEELFANHKHPYTKALFSSIPSLDPAKRRGLNPIPGEPPSLVSPPEGCRFASRCQEAKAQCREGEIELVEVSKGHRVRCIAL